MGKKLYQQVGGKIRSYRKLADLTQEKLAEKADLSVHYLSRIETGSATATLDALERIAQALEIKIGDLFQFRKDGSQEAKELLQHIIRLLRNRKPEEVKFFRNLILETIETFSK